MKFKREIPKLDSFSTLHFIKKLNTSIKSQNEIDMQKHLQKFEDFKKKEDFKIRESLEKIKQVEIKSRDLLINKLRTQAKKFENFNNAWEQNGLGDWKQNLIFKKEREKNDLEFELNQANKYKNKVLKSIKICEDEMEKKINNFEKVLKNNFLIERLEKNNIENTHLQQIDNINFNYNNNNNDYNKDNINGYTSDQNNSNKENLNFNSPKLSKLRILISPEKISTKGNNRYAALFKRKKILSDKLITDIKSKLIFDPQHISERDRRRRKLLVDLSGAYLEIDNVRKENILIEKTKKQSNQEKAFFYEAHKMERNKTIILENRKLRDEMYDERRDMELKFVDKNEEEFLNFHKENFQRTIELEFLKKRELDISFKQKERSKNTENCSQMINLILDIAEVKFFYTFLFIFN